MKGSNLSLPTVVSRRWRTFVLSGTATLAIFVIAYWLQPVRYRVFGLYTPPKTAFRANSSSGSTEVSSPQFLDQVLDFIFFRSQKLTPEAGFIKDDELLQIVIQQLEIKDFGGNPASPRSLRRRIRLSTPNQGETIKIALDDPDPEFAKQIIDRLMERYIEHFAAATPEETVNFTTVIQPHLVNAQTLAKQTQQALYQIQVGVSQSVLTPGLRAGDQTLELQSIGISAQQQLSTLDADLTLLRQVLQTATDSQKDLLRQVIVLGEARQSVLMQLRDTLNQPRDSDALSERLDDLEKQGLSLKKELTLTQDQYTRFLEKQQGPWSVSQAAQNRAQVIRSAALPSQGTRPFLTLFLGVGLLSSLGVGTLASYLRDRHDKTLVTLADIYAKSQMPILGIIPHFSAKDLSIQSLARQDGTEFPEFSQLMNGYTQTIQQFSLASVNRIPQVLALTSVTTGEGKSLTTANLAYLLAKLGKKVLLFDADLFQASQFEFWQVPQAQGFFECVVGGVPLGKALQRLHPNLDLLQAGYVQKNKDVLLNSPGISILIREFRTRYDHILIDTPALTDSVHGYLLANTADATVLVFRPGIVNQSDIFSLRETLGRSGHQLWGMVINDSSQSLQHTKTAKVLQESQWDATIRLQKNKTIIGFELSTLSAINPPQQWTESQTSLDAVSEPEDDQRRQKQEDYLYRLPLDELKTLVDVLWDDWSHDIELLLEQEEEVVLQSRRVRDLKTQVEQGNPYLKLSSELQLEEEQEKLNVLAETYIGQRSALTAEKEDLKFYLEILMARTDAECIPMD